MYFDPLNIKITLNNFFMQTLFVYKISLFKFSRYNRIYNK